MARGDLDAKLQAVRLASVHRFPTADIETVLDDIEQGYTGTEP